VATLHGWLFDVYPAGEGMRIWLIDQQGRPHALSDSFVPAFYARGPQQDLRTLCKMLRARRAPVELRRTERRELFLDQDVEVLEVGVRIPGQLPSIFRQAAEAHPYLTYYDADIPLPQRYVLERNIFPLAWCAVEHEDGNWSTACRRCA